MRAFIILCFVAAAWAEQLGYSYQPVAPSTSGSSYTSGSGYSNSDLSGIANLGIGNLGNGGLRQVGIGGIGVGGSGFDNLGGSVPSYNAPSYNAPAALEKQFYTFTAPESELDDGNVAQKIAGSVKQGLRVIFIKGPENNGLEKAVLGLAKQAAEQKTAIYVLNKQSDIGDLTHKLNAINQSNDNKPEVHFVKYRSPEDAVNAQKAIQDQYDSLGGTSQDHHGGVAPVLNFASHAPIQTAPAEAPGHSYLPSSIFRL